MAAPHPASMSREELERELLASRVLVAAWADAIAAGEAQLTEEGAIRLKAAASTVRVIYGRG